MYLIYEQLVQDYGAVTYEAFINLLVCGHHSFSFFLCSDFTFFKVDIMEDQTSADQLRESFRGISADKVRSITSRSQVYR